MYVLVSPFSKTFDDIGLTYIVPFFLQEKIHIGQIIEIPLREAIELGVIIDIYENIDTTYDESKIKSIISIKNESIFLSNYRVILVKWIASHYFTAIHNSINLFFPNNLKDKIGKDKLDLIKLNNDLSETKHIYTFNHKVKLSNIQEQTLNQIQNTQKNKILLYGLTGSGKTEIYIKLIKEYLDYGKQTLFLIPEIILTNQLSSKIKDVFGKEVLIINSTVTDATKTKYWLSINNGISKIIIGTRSALFYPYNNLGLIIIDEEHDNSYISDSAPRYNTIEVAEKITELNGNKLILASGTPSIKSMYKAVKGEYELINLLKKHR
ncbi:MAG: DEAD/DEAH box helicase family protein [Candidatus Gracilibacteria bacterium]|nr:DEAD/DEAH box helicase family protein [Candidatus Gracilibacteria bacterium]